MTTAQDAFNEDGKEQEVTETKEFNFQDYVKHL